MTWWAPLVAFLLLGLACIAGGVWAMRASERPPRCSDQDGCWGDEEHQ